MNNGVLLAPRDMYGKILAELGETNPDIFVLNADVAKATKVEKFASKFNERYLNVGICEQNMASIAAGLARAKFIPVMSTFACFSPGRCYDQIRQSIAYSNLNVKILSTHPGLSVGADGAIHQGLEDIALMRELPNFIVLAPSDSVETKKAIVKAIEHIGPVYVRIGRMECPVLFHEEWNFEIGKSYTLKEGLDLTLIAHGSMVHIIYEAANELEKKGVNVRVIDMPSIKPIDKKTVIRAAEETKGIIIAEDHSIFGGLYSAVCEITSNYSPCRVRGIAVQDTFGESGKPLELYKKYGLTKEHIIEVAMELLTK
jgi:transketolase